MSEKYNYKRDHAMRYSIQTPTQNIIDSVKSLGERSLKSALDVTPNL